MKYYLKTLSALYLIGGLLHILDLLDLRLVFSEMNLMWKIWIIYLATFNLLAAMGLWGQKAWGEYLFLLIASSQLIAYSGLFADFFGSQTPLIIFHVVTILLYVFFKRKPLVK